jgi:NAD(P)-dependent dehydrogenase (short-subunit alcohol dehydrogenase family)
MRLEACHIQMPHQHWAAAHDHRSAIVTGSTAGIGFAIAAGLAEAGAAVVINGRSQSSVDAATSRLAAKLPRAKVDGTR